MKTCFDIVSAEVDKARSGIAKERTLITEKYSILRGYCDAIDDIIREFDKQGEITAFIDEETLKVKVRFLVFDVTITAKNHMFCELVDRADRFDTYAVAPEILAVEFTFPSLW